MAKIDPTEPKKCSNKKNEKTYFTTQYISVDDVGSGMAILCRLYLYMRCDYLSSEYEFSSFSDYFD